MIYGVDVSHWNRDHLVRTNYEDFKKDFVIFKATEGRTYKDSALDHYLSIYLSNGIKPMGLYHYARPENNSAVVEADHFLEVAGSYIGKSILALDVEGVALNVPKVSKWVYEWSKHVYDKTGVRPLIYCSESACTRVSSAALNDLGCGLWCARWGANEPRKSIIKPWTFWAIWQNDHHPIDTDVFNGSVEQFKKYMVVNK